LNEFETLKTQLSESKVKELEWI